MTAASRHRIAALALATVIGIAVLGSLALQPGMSEAAARPATTGDSNLVVTIPGTASPSPSVSGSPNPQPSTPGGGGGGTSTPPPTEPTAPTVPNKPTVDAFDLRIEPDRVQAGDTIVATGTGFTPGEQVQFVVYSDPIVAGSFVAAADGSIVAEFETSEDLRLGRHTVEATGWVSQRVANDIFILVSPNGQGVSIFPGIVWTVAGSGTGLAIILYVIGAARGWFPIPFPALRKGIAS